MNDYKSGEYFFLFPSASVWMCMTFQYDIEAYHFDLPAENIAQAPAARRDESRLLVLDCKADRISHKPFGNVLELFNPGDLLVVNDTMVFPARLLGKKETGGDVELMILEHPGNVRSSGDSAVQHVQVTGLVKSSKRPRPGTRLIFGELLEGEVLEILPHGQVRVDLICRGEFDALLETYGMMPLPPYIRRNPHGLKMDRERYQTVFARHRGAVAAPTAGLHFTEKLLGSIIEKGVAVTSITLHVGYGTFSPVRVKDIREHQIHSEYYSISEKTAQLINKTINSRRSVWTVGTTAARVLEFVSDKNGLMRKQDGWCDLYIYPGYRFKVVKKMITNFHLPGSSLIFLVSALAGRERILKSYNEAIRQNYRFFSYGDAMAIMT